MINIESVRHNWLARPEFVIDRPYGHEKYTFIHFHQSVDLLINGEVITSSPHSCIIYDMGTPQYYHNKPVMTHDWFHCAGDLPQKLKKFGLEFDKLYYPANYQFVTSIVREIETECCLEKSFQSELIDNKVDELLIKLKRACCGQESAQIDPDTEERIRNLRGEIFMNLGHHWTVREMAKSVGLSESRFYNIYYKVFSNSPTNDLILARIETAKSALMFSNMPIAKIAEDMGYNNITHFIRQFKSFVGFSPAKFRKNHTYK